MKGRHIKIIILIFWIPAIIAILAFWTQYISLMQMLTIYAAVAIMQMTTLLYIFYRFFNTVKSGGIITTDILNTKVIIQKGMCNDKYIKANDSILPTFICSTNPYRNSVFRVKFVVSTDEEPKEQLKFLITRMRHSQNYEQEIDGIKPTKEGTYMFNIAVDPREKLNFKFNRDVTLQLFTVDELYLV